VLVESAFHRSIFLFSDVVLPKGASQVLDKAFDQAIENSCCPKKQKGYP